jgi:hypothetical protein
MSWRPLNSDDLSGVRKSQPSDDTRARPDFDVLPIQQPSGMGDSFFIGLAIDLNSRPSDLVAARQYLNAIVRHGETLFRP